MATLDLVDNVLQTLKGFCINSNATMSENAEDNKMLTGLPSEETIETAEKLRAFQLLPIAAATLKPDETRNKLIPLIESIITTAVDNGDDEALMVIGERLGEFVPLVGGGFYAASLLPLLARIICCVEEVVVVQAACDSLNRIIPTLDASVIDTNCLQLVRNIFADDLYCASRKAGVRLIPVLYKGANSESQVELRNRLLHLCSAEEEIPLVRAAAIEQLVELSQVAGASFKSDLIKNLTSLVNDNQRVVRASVVKPTLELARGVDAAEFDSVIMPLLDKLSEDTNRDTRRGLALVISDFQQIAQKFDKSLHLLLIKLMEDNEIDSRKIVAGNLKEFCSRCPAQVLADSVLPKIREHLNLEREDRVKAELVKSVVLMIPDFRREESLPLVQHVLSFLNETNPQTKQYVFEHFRGLIGLISPGELQLTIIPSLFKLFSDKNWRIRGGVVSSIKLVVPVVDEACCRETVLPAVVSWLRDPVWDIRQGSCEIVGLVTGRFPSLLSLLHLAPGLNSNSEQQQLEPRLADDPNYHMRQCWCCLMQALCSGATAAGQDDTDPLRAFLATQVLPTLLLVVEKDPVPNVQLTALRALPHMAPFLDKAYKAKMEAVLQVLIAGTSDSDVKYFSESVLRYMVDK